MNHPRVIRMMKDFDVGPYPIQFKLLYWSIRYRSVALRRMVGAMSTVRHAIGNETSSFINGHLNTGGVERSLADILRHMDYTKYTADVLLLEERAII